LSRVTLGHAKWTGIGQVMVKKSLEENRLNMAYNAHIFPTNALHTKPGVKGMENLVR
jgi:hypothetical protein